MEAAFRNICSLTNTVYSNFIYMSGLSGLSSWRWFLRRVASVTYIYVDYHALQSNVRQFTTTADKTGNKSFNNHRAKSRQPIFLSVKDHDWRPLERINKRKARR